jgi:hypothetical protein
MGTAWQHEEHVEEPPQPKTQDPEATENHDPATEDDDEKRGGGS